MKSLFVFFRVFNFVDFLFHILIEKILIGQTLNYGRFGELVLQTKRKTKECLLHHSLSVFEFDAMRSNEV